jgi:hypothetical protein
MSLIPVAMRVYIATNQSLAFEIREKLLQAILTLFPSGYFEDKLYDTHESGKGFRPGYVSFALKPLAWSNNDLIGGILVRGEYPAAAVRSTSPESGTPEYKLWVESGGNEGLQGGSAEIIKLTAGYYNKKASGSFQLEEPLGDAAFTITNLEEVEEVELNDPEQVKGGIETITQGVLKNPPDLAISHEKKAKMNVYTSLKKFIQFLRDEGRQSVKPSEIKLLADSTGQNLIKLEEKLKAIGFRIE